MSTLVSHPGLRVQNSDQRVVLRNISWSTYEKLLEDLSDQSVPRLFYDKGTLKIMSPSFEHAVLIEIVSNLIVRLVEEAGLEVVSFAPATFKREDIERGFEPDAGFFIQNAHRMIGKTKFDLIADPPPDLILEVDLTVSSLENFGIYAAFGVPELWIHTASALTFYHLSKGEYAESIHSAAFPWLTSESMQTFVERGKELGRIQLLKLFGEWVRAQVKRA